MYVTQSNRFPSVKRAYPNQWVEEDNLRNYEKMRSKSTVRNHPFFQVHFDLSIRNQRYLEIVEELVQPSQIRHLIKWIDNLSEKNMKGLRVLQKILHFKGRSKFTTKEQREKENLEGWNHIRNQLLFPEIQHRNSSSTLNSQRGPNATTTISHLKDKEAKQMYRKLLTQTSYQTQFPQPVSPRSESPSMAHLPPSTILIKTSDFSKLGLAKFLKPEAVSAVQTWLGLNSGNEELVDRVYHSLQDIYSVLKNYQKAETTQNDHYVVPKGGKASTSFNFQRLAMHGPLKKRPFPRDTNIISLS